MYKRIITISISLFLLAGSFAATAYAHSGKTDANGGHYQGNNGEYHYHHGYPAHQHTNGSCPYDYDDKTNHNGGSGSNKDDDVYDCGRKDCNIGVPHAHANKATTTTTTTTKVDIEKKSDEGNDIGFNIIGGSILILSIGFIFYCDFLDKRRK